MRPAGVRRWWCSPPWGSRPVRLLGTRSVTRTGTPCRAAAGGLPSGVPARPETAPDFVPVGDTPPPRDLKTLTEAERKKLEADLVTLRDRQEGKTSHPQEQ